jgi:hypothetical protein
MTKEEQIDDYVQLFYKGCKNRWCTDCVLYNETTGLCNYCLWNTEKMDFLSTDVLTGKKFLVEQLNKLDSIHAYCFKDSNPDELVITFKEGHVSEPVNSMLVYIASPYTKGDNFINVQRQITTAVELLSHAGIVPLCPLLNSVWINMQHEFSYDKWMDVDYCYLSRCDALLRLSGESSGADKEVAYAAEHNIPIFYTVEELIQAVKKN